MASKQRMRPSGKSASENNTTLPAENFTRMPSTTLVLGLLLLLIAILAYSNTLENSYAYDDMSAVTQNTIVTRGISALPEIFSTPYRYGFYPTPNDLYRPLSLAMFAIEFQLSGGAPGIMHFMNVLVYGGCVLLLFIFFDTLFERKNTAVAFIAALLFALHPLHTEVVANIKSRDELVCFFFAFSGLLIFIKYARGGNIWHFIAGTLCFSLSLFSKETAVTFIAVIPLVFFFYVNNNKRRSTLVTITCVVAMIIFLLVRFAVLEKYHSNDFTFNKFIDNPLVNPPSPASGLATKIFVLGKYVMLLFIPYPLTSDYSYNSIPFVYFNNVWVLLSLVVYGCLAGISIYRLVKYPKDVFAFGGLFFLITIALFSNIVFLIGAEMAERFVFFASAGFCLLCALAIKKCMARDLTDVTSILLNKKVITLLAVVATTYSFITINRNKDWADSLTLYRADVDKIPNDARGYMSLGNDLLIAGNQSDPATLKQNAEEAISLLKKSVAIYPDYDDGHKILANGYFFTSQYDSAEVHYKRAITLRPNDMEPINNLAVVYFNAKKYHDAIVINRKGIDVDPHYLTGYNNIGICYMQLQRWDSAIATYSQAILVDNSFNGFYENIAVAYTRINNMDSAKKYEAIARQRNPGFRAF